MGQAILLPAENSPYDWVSSPTMLPSVPKQISTGHHTASACVLRPCWHTAHIISFPDPLLLKSTTWLIPCNSWGQANLHNRLQDHLIMALPSSSTLCLVLLLMPTAHSEPCTLTTLLCSLASSRTKHTSRVLTHHLQAFAYASTGMRSMRPTIEQGAVQTWQEDVPNVAGSVELRGQRHLMGHPAALQVCLREEAHRN